ncbi:MAG: glycosyltransferase family 39 protein, partial [candidate division Zixibacteria bacterium]|nr:glycosyltransferase family 39 protein [candidate division Zixibacteria bacterium]
MTQNKVKTAFALIFIGAGLWFAFFGLARPFWAVECCTVEIADASWSGILENLKTNAHSPPLYYFLLKPWMSIFGADEAGARSLSAVFYLLSIPALFLLGKTLFDRKTGILC